MQRITRILIPVLALVCGAFQAQAQTLQTQPLDRIVAVVEEDVILASELDRATNTIRRQYANQPGRLPPDDVLERQVLERQVMVKLQVMRAASSGIRVSDLELDQSVAQVAAQNSMSLAQLRGALEQDGFRMQDFRDTLRDEMIVQRLRQRVIDSRVDVTETEVDILLAGDNIRTGEVRLGHILIAVPESADPDMVEAARQKAEGVKKLIDEGMEFAAAAIRYSDGQQALDGGDLGWRPYDRVPSLFSDMIGQMKPGDVTPPVRAPGGFHIVKLAETREASQRMVTEFNARHIVVKVDELTTSDEALAEIRELRSRVVGGEDFAEVARKHSKDDGTAALGGDMGWFEVEGYGTRVGEVLRSLNDGQISEPFQTELGWHVLQRLGTREQDRTVDFVRDQARENIRRRKADEEYETWLRQLRDESFVEMRLASAQAPAAVTAPTP